MSPDPVLDGSPYQAYLYAYPHKTAYRPLAPRRLEDVWAGEDTGSLFLYVHVPFCEMRCGFCNLFTVANPAEGAEEAFVAALERQAAAVRRALPGARFARFAMGGGTPTHLGPEALARALDVAASLGADLAALPSSVEASPATASAEKLRLLAARGVARISLGVQSFRDDEARAAGRTQARGEVLGALDAIRAAGFPILNVDLIYGLPGQTVDTLTESLREALRFAPEELYLYPLYVRPLTGLGRGRRAWDDQRLALYRAARAWLAAEGYEAVSMRMFRRVGAPVPHGPVYCVQDDGMIGLGPGARSYTRGLHYATRYAVSAPSVRAIVTDWAARSDAAHGAVDHGFALDADEQRRRWVLLALLDRGLDLGAYRARFGSDAIEDLRLGELEARGWAERSPATGPAAAGALTLTPAGYERSDAIGPWLVSPAVRARMDAHELA